MITGLKLYLLAVGLLNCYNGAKTVLDDKRSKEGKTLGVIMLALSAGMITLVVYAF